MAIGLQSRRRTMFDVCVSILALVVVARAIVDSFAPRDPRFGSVASGLVLCAVALPLTAILCRHAVQLVNLGGAIRVATGEIIRALTINRESRYHGTGRPPGGPKGPRKANRTGP